MKDCLNCGKQYENKREASKFCSDKCRVAYNRKNPKDKVTKVQMQVLYNELLELAGKINKEPQTRLINPISPQQHASIQNIENKNQFTTVTTVKPKSMNAYFEDKRECACDEDYHNWLASVDSDPYLTAKQKQILKTTNPSGL